ncbi:unnamed protein product [Sphagnum balticum]
MPSYARMRVDDFIIRKYASHSQNLKDDATMIYSPNIKPLLVNTLQSRMLLAFQDILPDPIPIFVQSPITQSQLVFVILLILIPPPFRSDDYKECPPPAIFKFKIRFFTGFVIGIWLQDVSSAL